ncbi:hypothetical protein BREVNS_0403 [Brevinematales bacterium NS]|nr:hypothetical protein BREVNS_0403 [Brevinematales bacterium NS]
MKRILLFIRNRFLEGLLLVIPLLGVFFLLKWIFLAIHKWMETLVSLFQLQSFFRVNVWLLELFTLLGLFVFLLLLSVLLRTFLGRWFRRTIENFFEHFPGIGSLYGAIKQIASLVFHEENQQLFQTVVLVDFPGDRTKSLGFLMGKLKKDILPENLQKTDLFVVYIPTAPFPTTGYLLLVEEPNMQKTDLTWEEAVRIIFSGGMLDADRKD